MSKYNDIKRNKFIIHHPFPEIYLASQKLTAEDKEIGIIGTRPPISRFFSPIDRNIAFAQTKRLNDR